MPQFNTGESKTANVIMRNPTGKAFDYDGFVYFGAGLAVVSEKAFSLAAGEQKQVSFPVVMPTTPGTYPVNIGVFSGGKNIALYRATEDVVIAAPLTDPSIIFLSLDWTLGAQASDFLANSEQTASIGFNTSLASAYTLELGLVLAGVVTVIGSVSINPYQVGNFIMDSLKMPSIEGVYDVLIRTYRAGVLTGIYPSGQLTVYGIAEPSNLAYQNLSFSLKQDPAAPAWQGMVVACDIKNIGSTTITREVALWLHFCDMGLSDWSWQVIGNYPGYYVGRVAFTLAPGGVFHYVLCQTSRPYDVSQGQSCIELRDNMGGKSAYSCLSWGG